MELKAVFKHDAMGGIMLVISAILAIGLANSAGAHYYNMLIDIPVVFQFGPLILAKPLLLWINDGLMAVFFFVIGLELKRELMVGELSDRRQAVLPVIAAVGGMVVPGAIFAAINWGDEQALRGWATPTATDIAFSLGVLSLFGKRVPLGLKMFLVSLAIFDDLGAIIIIALYYSGDISIGALQVAFACMVLLAIFNYRGVSEFGPYVLVGLIMWVAVLKSGVHATLAGTLLACFIPLTTPRRKDYSPLKVIEKDLTPMVVFGILPIFAFANAGVPLENVSWAFVLHPVSMGVVCGLFIGKQIGVTLFAWLAVRSGVADMPNNVTWYQIYGVSLLCGIGFTMSLFVGSLAYVNLTDMLFDERLGILMGSFLSALCGMMVLQRALPKLTVHKHQGPKASQVSA